MDTFAQAARPSIVVAILLFATSAFAQDATWTVTTWTGPATGMDLPAVASPSTFGLDGRALLVCEEQGPGGLTMVIASPELAELPDDDVLVGYRMDMEDEVLHDPGTWTRQGDGSVVRYVGPDDLFAEMLQGLSNAVSPAFMVVVGEIAEENLHVMVLESHGLAAALSDLPCSVGGT